MLTRTLAITVLAMTLNAQSLPPPAKNEVIVLNGVNWVIRVANKHLKLERRSVLGSQLNEYVVNGRTIKADKAFWEASEAEKRRLLVTKRFEVKDGSIFFDGYRINCGGKEVARLMGDAISLGEGVVVGVEIKGKRSAYPGFIHLLYFDPVTQKSSIHEVVGNMSSLDFIFFTGM